MNKLSQLWRRLLFYLRRERFDRELEEEMRFHLEMKAEENLYSQQNTTLSGLAMYQHVPLSL